MCRVLFCAYFMATLALVVPAWGLSQPGSTAPLPYIDQGVPFCSNQNVQHCLDDAEGEAGVIDAQLDGRIAAETFDPRCNLTFHLLNRGAAYKNIFGWYNVVPDPNSPGKTLRPALSDLHAFILGDENAPLTRTLALRDDPAYAGGLIGFFIATGYTPQVDAPEGASLEERLGKPPLEGTFDNLFYSERAFNPDNQATPSIHLITWQSVTHRDSFYFGWEDLLIGGDDDFDDILTRVDGIQCAGGGGACDTGELGVCGEGTLACQRGELACVPNHGPSEEVCNALDDDCDGSVDEGDGLCAEGFVCSRGQCVPACGTGEFRCAAGLVCNSDGACMDPACVGVTCAAGEVCEGGTCLDGCDGVTCPYGQLCRLGRCVDPCDAITCDDGYSCHLGQCVDCDCRGCSDGFVCSRDVCVEDACQSVSCQSGTHCDGGRCIDDCSGVKCPGGAACVLGQCEAPVIDPGSGGGEGGGGGGVVVLPTAGTGGGGGAGAGSGGGAGQVEFEARSVSADRGCACRALGSQTSGSAAGLALAAAAGLYLTRRRRRSG